MKRKKDSFIRIVAQILLLILLISILLFMLELYRKNGYDIAPAAEELYQIIIGFFKSMFQ